MLPISIWYYALPVYNPFEDWAGAAEFFLALRKGCPEPIPDR